MGEKLRSLALEVEMGVRGGGLQGHVSGGLSWGRLTESRTRPWKFTVQGPLTFQRAREKQNM